MTNEGDTGENEDETGENKGQELNNESDSDEVWGDQDDGDTGNVKSVGSPKSACTHMLTCSG